MILLIDNYDSFTYNLEQYLGELNHRIKVFRNDAIHPEELPEEEITGIVISPGPGRPKDAGISSRIIDRYGKTLPILGVCLGHQCIGKQFGARIVEADEPTHGKTTAIRHTGTGVFEQLKNPLEVARYHSLVIDPKTLPPELTVTARTPTGTIMGLQHRRFPLTGIQFHPESILTEQGKQLLKNFTTAAESFRQQKPLEEHSTGTL